MYIGGYLVLIIVGALLRWAVIYHSTGFDIQAAGLIIMLVGIVGLVIAVLFWFDGRGYAPPWRRIVHEHVVRDEAPTERVVHERVVREDRREEPPPTRRERVIREYVPPPHDEEDDGNPYYDPAEEDTWEHTAPRPGDRTRPPGG
jgi:hypothetical protein